MQNLLLAILLLFPVSSVPQPQAHDSDLARGVPTASDYRGYWTGTFDAPVPEELLFLFNFKLNGTWTAHVTNTINMSTTMTSGTFFLDGSGVLLASNSSGNPAFSAFPSGSNKLDMVMVNTGGPGIPGCAYKGVQQ